MNSDNDGCGCWLLILAIGFGLWFFLGDQKNIPGKKVSVAIIEKQSNFSGSWDRVALVYGFRDDVGGAQDFVDLANRGSIGKFRVAMIEVSRGKLKRMKNLKYVD